MQRLWPAPLPVWQEKFPLFHHSDHSNVTTDLRVIFLVGRHVRLSPDLTVPTTTFELRLGVLSQTWTEAGSWRFRFAVLPEPYHD